jgi:hypothetical protein
LHSPSFYPSVYLTSLPRLSPLLLPLFADRWREKKKRKKRILCLEGRISFWKLKVKKRNGRRNREKGKRKVRKKNRYEWTDKTDR